MRGLTTPFFESDAATFSQTLDVNLKGVFFGTKHATLAMKEAGVGGSIVNIASIAGLSGEFGPVGES